jgi:hypothetical protein
MREDVAKILLEMEGSANGWSLFRIKNCDQYLDWKGSGEDFFLNNKGLSRGWKKNYCSEIIRVWL